MRSVSVTDLRARPAIAAAADDLIDDQVGIIRFAGMSRRQAGSPEFFHFWSQAADTGAFAPRSNFARTGGAATEPDRALAKALGEGIERYCAAIYDQAEFPLCSAADAPFPCADPASFALNSAQQYAEPGFVFTPFDRTTPVRWAAARDAQTGADVHVPAAMVYVPYHFVAGSSESPIVQPISTGLACHESYERAANVAMCEVIERDAFMIVWLASLSMPRLDPDSLPPTGVDLVERFRRAGVRVTLLDITLDTGIPTILAVARQTVPDVAALVVAAAAGLDPWLALRSSLEELAHTAGYCQEIVRTQPRLAPDPEHLNVIDQSSHLNYWCDQANAPDADFLTASPVTRRFSDLPNLSTGSPSSDFDVIAARVAATGHRALLRELTTPDVAEVGLSVIRAVIPGFHPLVSGHRYRALGGRRLWEVPARLGLGGLTVDGEANPLPHPYP